VTQPLLDRLALHGADADCGALEAAGPGDATRLIAAIRRAVELRDAPDDALAAWDEAGALHDPETLDEALAAVAPGLGIPFVSGLRRRRLRDAARRAFRKTSRPGTLRLLAAVLGAVGKRDDAEVLETVALHPAFTLHGATALANLSHWQGRAALLRVLSRVHGAERVLVIDRLLPFVGEPAVRLALVRDAFTGLAEDHAREIAPAVAETLQLEGWLAEERTPEDLREAARRILALAGRASA
jgi:hypothetical protein